MSEVPSLIADQQTFAYGLDALVKKLSGRDDLAVIVILTDGKVNQLVTNMSESDQIQEVLRGAIQNEPIAPVTARVDIVKPS